jgi:hypothetical protein
MAQALSEFRSPVGQEALRLRMVAMNGREDPLLDAARFQRLLRQANDAEVADVRKVGDDDYEIALQRSSSRPALPPAPRAEPQDAAPGGAPAAAEPAATGSRENGQRLGLRFRRGSRGPMRAADIPLVGMVSIEPLSEPEREALPAALEPVEDATDAAAKPKRRAAPRRKRTTAAPAQSAPGDGEESMAPPPPPKRPRPRARKKPE